MQTARRLPEPEEELDLREYGRSVVARWWLVLAALALGAVVGWLTVVGGGEVWRARAVVYLGQPIAPSGEAQIQSASTNPSTAGVIVRSDEVVEAVTAEVGVPGGQLRAGISTKAVEGAITRLGQTPLIEVSVRGPWGRQEVAQAADLLAAALVERVSGFAQAKIDSLRTQLQAFAQELAGVEERISTIEAQIDGGGLAASDRLVLVSLLGVAEQRRTDLVGDRAEMERTLAIGQEVEAGRVLTEARGAKVSARSARSSIVVGALIGLIAGVALALLADPLTTRLRRADT